MEDDLIWKPLIRLEEDNRKRKRGDAGKWCHKFLPKGWKNVRWPERKGVKIGIRREKNPVIVNDSLSVTMQKKTTIQKMTGRKTTLEAIRKKESRKLLKEEKMLLQKKKSKPIETMKISEEDNKKMTEMEDDLDVGVIGGMRRFETLRQDNQDFGQVTPPRIRKPRKSSISKLTPSKGGEDGLRNVVRIKIPRKSAKKK